jgi:guanylate kinase
MPGKLVIFSAPSGAGKTTIVKSILKYFPQLEFSISACSREKRPKEKDGKDYYFLSKEAFEEKIRNNEFLEWEEVYHGSYYGTLKSETTRIWKKGNDIIFDVDVKGGLNIKKQFGDKALAIFVMPPNISQLEARLRHRHTESEESLKKRINKAEYEMKFAKQFDKILINDELQNAIEQAKFMVGNFLRE